MTCCSFLSKKKSSQTENSQNMKDIPGIDKLKIYAYKQLKNATADFSFSNKVGEGGFGSVYKGKFKDGTTVAIKVLSSESRQGAREFLTELTVISDIVHENLVKLYGCCAEGDHRILVYNYLENNSLAQSLLGSNHSSIQFNWKTRVRICIGVARGLAFLHEEAQPQIIHRDIKASNILLDKDLTPKISDFGLAKLLPPNATHISTRVAGTIGYLAPEYAIRGQVTKKSDVYSFGILLLEIVSGRSNTNTKLPSEEQYLLERTWSNYERGEVETMIDASLSDDLDIDEAVRFLKIGLLCTQDSMKLRPSMPTVIRMLTGKKDITSEKISRPGLVSDLMELKVKKPKKLDDGSISPVTSSSVLDSSKMSSDNDTPSTFTATNASLTFTEVHPRD